MIEFAIGDYSFESKVGSNEVKFFLKGKFMDKWFLHFDVATESQLKEYVKLVIKNWK